ncbi:pyridoxamine 5'-phosphate oxidase family protein [Streptomyces sp. NPDC000594]|uniref:pyridoxamine 5'-phosphate oxidase family protein n=1 Tax=Streptomyces sp. NPDC000594 TaxID=3154261 RepID=UPI003326ADC0
MSSNAPRESPRTSPRTELNADYSEEGATALGWPEAESLLAEAELFWLSTVRPDGRPHVTPLIAVWSGGGLHFCTGRGERKELNLRVNPEVVLTTGVNTMDGGTDLVIEGRAERVTDDGRLRTLARAYREKYGAEWAFEAADGFLVGDGGPALAFRVAPRTAFGFAKDPYGQTRWSFPAPGTH